MGKETAIPLVLVFLAVPAVGVSGLSLPVPPAVERLAASLVPIGPAYTRDVELDTTAPVRRVRVTLAPEEKAALAAGGTAAASARPARVPDAVKTERPRAEPFARTSAAAKPVRAARPAVRPVIETPSARRTPVAGATASTPSVPSALRRNDRRLVDDGPAAPARGDATPAAGGPPHDEDRGRGAGEAAGGDAPRPVQPRPKPEAEQPDAAAKGQDKGRSDDGATGPVAPEPTATTHPGNGKAVGPQKGDEPVAGEPVETRNGHGKGGVNAGGAEPAAASEPAPAPEPVTATEPPADEPSTDAAAAEPAPTATGGEPHGNGNGNGRKGAA